MNEIELKRWNSTLEKIPEEVRGDLSRQISNAMSDYKQLGEFSIPGILSTATAEVSYNDLWNSNQELQKENAALEFRQRRGIFGWLFG